MLANEGAGFLLCFQNKSLKPRALRLPPVAHFRCHNVTSGCQYAAWCGAGKRNHRKDVNQATSEDQPKRRH